MNIAKSDIKLEARENPTALGKELAALTWLATDARSLYRENIDLCIFFTRVAERASVLIKDKPVRFTLDLDPMLGKIFIDPTRFLQTIENLLADAIMCTTTGALLLMARPIQQDDGLWVAVTVSDTVISTGKTFRVLLPARRKTDQHGTAAGNVR